MNSIYKVFCPYGANGNENNRVPWVMPTAKYIGPYGA